MEFIRGSPRSYDSFVELYSFADISCPVKYLSIEDTLKLSVDSIKYRTSTQIVGFRETEIAWMN